MALDLELVVELESQDEIIAFMESLGFETLYQSAGYSNHLHSDVSVDREEIRHYFKQHGLQERFDDLEGSL